MRKFFIYLALIIFISSCEKYLDKTDEVGLVEEDVFSRYEGVRGYLDACYRALPDHHSWDAQALNRAHISTLSDEMGNMVQNNMSIINSGTWLNRANIGEIGYNNPEEAGTIRAPIMDNAFLCLRIANKVIEKINDVPGLTNQQRDQLLGQAYFFRGWFYFQIIQRMGGMPIYDKAYRPEDDMDFPRLNYAESNEFVIQNMDEAIKLLPDLWPAAETGRASKAAAMAVKAMAMLYAASPLMQNDINTTVDKPYNNEQCERAAQYANDLIKYCEAKTGGTNYRLLDAENYKFIFYHAPNNASDESIWYNMDAGARNQERGMRCMYLPQFWSGQTGIDAAAYSDPTQNIVELFEKINNGVAYPITDPRSGYDPQNPFVDRDPRLNNNIIVPGEQWGSTSNNRPAYQELYTGGRDALNAANNNSTRNREITGYICKKFIWPEANFVNRQYTAYRMNTVFIRLAQVYLDYAEAMNEAYGPNADPKGYGLTAVQAINLIRNRVGMPNVAADFTSSKETFRDRIRNERTVELMFENHRWHDLRRWMIAENLFRTPIKGLVATPPANHASVTNKSTLKFTYSQRNLVTEVRVFERKHYWYPVAQDQVNYQANYKQNPGW